VNLVAIASVALLLVVTGFWMMERVKGPLYRISRELARIREGNLEGPINLRGKDEFKDVAEALNGMLDGMRERAFDFKRDFNNISRDIEKLKTERATGKPIIDDASRIAGKVAKLRERLEL
jgi:methyl-accepting chemotaxis protein